MRCDCPFCERNHFRLNPTEEAYYYDVNPDAEDRAIKKIDEILNDLTPCDKKDWGLLRNPRWYYRNPYYYW